MHPHLRVWAHLPASMAHGQVGGATCMTLRCPPACATPAPHLCVPSTSCPGDTQKWGVRDGSRGQGVCGTQKAGHGRGACRQAAQGCAGGMWGRTRVSPVRVLPSVCSPLRSRGPSRTHVGTARGHPFLGSCLRCLCPLPHLWPFRSHAPTLRRAYAQWGAHATAPVCARLSRSTPGKVGRWKWGHHPVRA
jgi:hypothetical protein